MGQASKPPTTDLSTRPERKRGGGGGERERTAPIDKNEKDQKMADPAVPPPPFSPNPS
jgi:hypothetical protein